EMVARVEIRALHLTTVHLEAVGRVEGDDPEAGPLLPALRVAARDVRVLDLDVALARAAEHHAALVDAETLAVPGEHRHLALQRERLRRGGLVRNRRRVLVDHRRAGLDLLLHVRAACAVARLHHPRGDAELPE